MKLYVLALILLAVPLLAADKPETPEEVQSAQWELSQFAYAHECDFWEGDKVDGKWTVDIVQLAGKTGTTTWKEVGFARALQAVDALEQDFAKHPDGYEGHAEGGK